MVIIKKWNLKIHRENQKYWLGLSLSPLVASTTHSQDAHLPGNHSYIAWANCPRLSSLIPQPHVLLHLAFLGWSAFHSQACVSDSITQGLLPPGPELFVHVQNFPTSTGNSNVGNALDSSHISVSLMTTLTCSEKHCFKTVSPPCWFQSSSGHLLADRHMDQPA